MTEMSNAPAGAAVHALTIRRHPGLDGEFEITTGYPYGDPDLDPYAGAFACLFAKQGNCTDSALSGPADYTAVCSGHGHKVFGNWCQGHMALLLPWKKGEGTDKFSCGTCAADGHRCELKLCFDKELLDGPVPETDPAPLYPWKYATPSDAAWWGQLDGRADYARFPGILGDDEEISRFLGDILNEDPAMRGPARDRLAAAYRDAWNLGLQWLDRALPGTMGRACTCGHDGRGHLVIYNARGPEHRARCKETGCQCRRFTPAPEPLSAPDPGGGTAVLEGPRPRSAATAEERDT